MNQVFVSKSDGSSPKQITRGDSLNTVADWADDNLITYVSVDIATFQSQVKSISGDGSVQLEMVSDASNMPGKGLL